MLDDVIRSAERVSSLTAELLAFARPLPPSLCLVSLDGIVRGLEQVLKRAVTANVGLQFELESGDCDVRVDPAQMEQALVHLVINASEAMPSGGKLTISTRPALEAEAEVVSLPSAGLVEDGVVRRYVVLAVRDTGVGMSAEAQARVFEPFFSTKKEARNVGLGLTTVYSIVGRNNGYITIESEPGHGAEFRIFLPVADEQDVK